MANSSPSVCRLVFAALLLSTLFALGPTLKAQGLTPIQTMRLQSVSSVIDAGKNGVLFTRVVPRLADGGVGAAQRHLFHLPPGDGAKEKRLLTTGGGFAVWGDKVTYVGRPADSAHNEVMSKSLVGGETARVTLTPNGVRSYKWSPDFRYIAYTQMDPLPADRAKRIEYGFKHLVHDEDCRHIGLYLWDSRSGSVRPLTRNVSVFDFVWAPDSKRMALAVAPRNLVDDSYMFKRIHTVDLQGNLDKVIDNPGKLGDMAFSPNGRELAYISAADKRDPHAGMLYLLDVASGKSKPLTDGFRGMVHHIHWGEKATIDVLISRGVRTSIASVDPTTAKMTTRFHDPSLAIAAFSAGTAMHLVASTANHPSEVFSVDSGKNIPSAERVTHSNPWLEKEGADRVRLGKQETIQFKARDGLAIEGILMYPVGYEKGTRYPMVIVAHGGPESHFTNGWNTSYGRWGQMLCARGYFAWYPNYRSSTGYGVEFTKHDHGDVMGGEFNDHIDAIAHFDGLGLIDKKRVGIGGGSYGGYTAAWAATKETAHFAAAVSFVPFVDIRTKWYTSDIPWEFYYVHYEEKHAHEQAGYLRDRSPLTWASDCRTPLLLLGGTADPRVHPSQPHMLYRAVQFSTKTPVRYVQYPGEGHGNRTNTNQYDFALRTLRWFDHYLMGTDRRSTAPPPYELDYTAWYRTR